MDKTYWIYISKTSSRHKVTKERYTLYMQLVGIISDKPRTFENELISGLVEEHPPYYMRDNHTFKELHGSIEEMIAQIKDEFDDGYTYGMLCSHHKPGVVHWNGEWTESKVVEAALWLKSYLEKGELNENNCNS